MHLTKTPEIIPPAPFAEGGVNNKNLITNGFHRPYNPGLKGHARTLRKNMSEPERKLWFQCLRQLPLRFLRQKPIDNYIVDFYCARLKLVIEIDGDNHYFQQQQSYDALRTQVLEKHGLKVVRFTNNDVMQNFEGVCEEISKLINYE